MCPRKLADKLARYPAEEVAESGGHGFAVKSYQVDRWGQNKFSVARDSQEIRNTVWKNTEPKQSKRVNGKYSP